MSLSETEAHWREFLCSLNNRELHDVELIVSDAHEGLKAARENMLAGNPWQRFVPLMNDSAETGELGGRQHPGRTGCICYSNQITQAVVNNEHAGTP